MGELQGAYMASARQRDTRWTGLYRDQQGRQRSAGTFDTKTQALKAARAAEALGASGIDPRPVQTEMLYPSARRGRMTVAGYSDEWLGGHRLEPTSRATYQAMLKHIVRELGSVPLADLDAPKVRSFIRAVEATGLSGSTVGLIMTTLRMMCETAVADRLMDRNPCSGIKIASRRSAGDEDSLALGIPRRPGRDPRALQAAGRDGRCLGMRWGELMGLQGPDVMPNGSGFTVQIRRVMIEVAGKTSLRGYASARRDQGGHHRPRPRRKAHRRPARRDPDGFMFRAEKGGALRRCSFRGSGRRRSTGPVSRASGFTICGIPARHGCSTTARSSSRCGTGWATAHRRDEPGTCTPVPGAGRQLPGCPRPGHGGLSSLS